MNDRTFRSLRASLTRGTMAATLLALSAVAANAQSAPMNKKMKEDAPGLLARATVLPDSARAIARARIPAAQIADEGIEMEHGKLVYSFDMKTLGRRGIDEVVIDALSGAVISVDHEGPKAEAAERAQDERERRAKRDSVRRRP